MLAGVRGIKPRPVGFKFHAVLVVNSAHLASLAAPGPRPLAAALLGPRQFQESRRPPIARRSNDWVMPPIAETQVPSPAQAGSRFLEAMDNWDEEAADRAIAGLAPHRRRQRGLSSCSGATAPATSATSATRRFSSPIPGARCRPSAGDMPSRCCVRWRSPCCEHEGEQPGQARRRRRIGRGRENLERGRRIRRRLAAPAEQSPKRRHDVLATLRTRHASIDAGEQVIGLLKNRQSIRSSLWDALVPGGRRIADAPARHRRPAPRHQSANALHYAYQMSGNDETRGCCCCKPRRSCRMFREVMHGRGKLRRPAHRHAGTGRREAGDSRGVRRREQESADSRAEDAGALEGGPDPGRTVDGGERGGLSSPRAATRTTTSSARRCWRTIITSHRHCGRTSWRRACSICAAPATATMI